MNLSNLLLEYLKSQDFNFEENKIEEFKKEIFLRMRKMIYELIIEKEMEMTLGYARYDKCEKETSNRRNGIRTRSLVTRDGVIEKLRIPRDREGIFYPRLLNKYERKERTLDEIIYCMYQNGNSTRQITKLLEDVFDFKYSPSSISKITDEILEEVEKFKKRELKKEYYVIFLDAIFVNLRRDTVEKEGVYFVLGVTNEGYRDILGFYIYPTESSVIWEEILEDLKRRGVEEVLLFVSDGLSGLF